MLHETRVCGFPWRFDVDTSGILDSERGGRAWPSTNARFSALRIVAEDPTGSFLLERKFHRSMKGSEAVRFINSLKLTCVISKQTIRNVIRIQRAIEITQTTGSRTFQAVSIESVRVKQLVRPQPWIQVTWSETTWPTEPDSSNLYDANWKLCVSVSRVLIFNNCKLKGELTRFFWNSNLTKDFSSLFEGLA